MHTDTPNPAVISEAIELSEEFSTDDSAPFLNGLLGAVIAHEPARAEDLPSDDAASSSLPVSDEDIEQPSSKIDDAESMSGGAHSDLSPAEVGNVDLASGNASDAEHSAAGTDVTDGENLTSEVDELATDLDKTDATDG